MTNPNNAIGTNAAYNGRTSVNAFNDSLSAYNRGIISGWACVPNVGLTVSVGGVSGTRDVAVAEDNAGNKTTINNISAQPINVTLAAAPVSNSRIDLIVIYVDGSPQGVSTVTDNPSACGIVAVKGTASATPSVPNDSAIRAAITADGAAGTTAYYTIVAQITMATGTTDITSGMISGGVRSELALIGAVVSEPTSLAYIDTVNIVDGAVTADKIDFTTLTGGNIPIVASTMHIPYLTADDNMNVWRIGNIVFAFANVVVSSLATYDSIVVAEKMPSGFRPTTGTMGMFILNSVVGASSTIGMTISPNGSVAFSNRATISASTRFYGCGCWITKDNWPN